MFGELALILGTKRTASAKAVTKTETFMLTKVKYHYFDYILNRNSH